MVGESALLGGLSYFAIGRETAFKTYNTCTALLPILSNGLVTTQEGKVLEEITGNRNYQSRIPLTRKIGGEVELYVYPKATATAYLLQNAFGGTITSATATGELTGGAAYEHVFDVGNFNDTHSSICVNNRKGDSVNGKVFQYNGVRVGELMFTSEIDDALLANVSLMGIDSTSGGTDIQANLTYQNLDALSFVSGRISVADNLAAITTTSFWHVQSIEFGFGNGIKDDESSGRIGSQILDVLPAGMVAFTFNVSMRFDTTTAYDAMKNANALAAQLEWLGATITGSTLRESIKFDLPKIFVNEAPEPEIGGPDETLVSDISFAVLRNSDTTTGYAVRCTLRNGIASY